MPSLCFGNTIVPSRARGRVRPSSVWPDLCFVIKSVAVHKKEQVPPGPIALWLPVGEAATWYTAPSGMPASYVPVEESQPRKCNNTKQTTARRMAG